ncbi:hypothetical protein FH972_022735 [Carpinus fangiana]|uniref:Inosine/uridine-preferring nucleoside hydrolase domain-containing protein n=1 Tax=Carpinus fangiana TaxID=176857 RepID=A0A5N6KT39_9ROSI|nr:hypothetical protein FH972_022735 [Carpinus fangiana]
MAATPKRTPIWLDCDTGHDDAYALLLAAHHPSAHLLGVSTTHGNAPVHHTTRNTRAVLHAIARPDTLLIRGADRPLSRAPLFAPDYHGESGLDGVALLPNLPRQDDENEHPSQLEPLEVRIDGIAQVLFAQAPRSTWLVATGPLTNVAHLLQRHPQLAGHLAGISVMGGVVGGGFTDAPLGNLLDQAVTGVSWFGNWTPVAEFNILVDPEAANAVFANQNVGKVMAGLDLTHLCRAVVDVREMILRREARSVAGEQGVKLREMMHQVMVFFAASYATHSGIADGPPLHDPLAVMAALEPGMFEDGNGERWNVGVVIEREGYDKSKDPTNRTGQTVLTPTNSDDNSATRVPRGVDLDAFWSRVDECLSKAERELLVRGTNLWTT